MREHYNLEDWKEIFEENNVIDLLNSKLSYKEVSGILNDRGYKCTPEAIRKAVKRLGYTYDSIREKLINEETKEFNKLINSWDIEELIGGYAAQRYYNSYVDEELSCDQEDYIEIPFHKDVLKEYIDIANEMGIENEMDYMYLVLLEHLDKIRPLDKSEEFNKRYYKEYGE